jgi:pimeloyl-[acyl-carrier protein] methyl ester esterase
MFFIHGWCMSSAVWMKQRIALSSKYRVISIDLRGHGKSSLPGDGFHSRGCAEDIVGLLEYLDITAAMIVGWSLGVFIAMESFLLDRSRIAKLVLVSGTPLFVSSPDFPYGLSSGEASGMALKVQRNIQRAVTGFMSLMFTPEEIEKTDVDAILASVTIPTTDVALQALDSLISTDMREQLSVITCPTLIINGDRDRICLPEASDFMKSHIEQSQQMVFAGCGHAPFLTQSSKFNASLEEFGGRTSAADY